MCVCVCVCFSGLLLLHSHFHSSLQHQKFSQARQPRTATSASKLSSTRPTTSTWLAHTLPAVCTPFRKFSCVKKIKIKSFPFIVPHPLNHTRTHTHTHTRKHTHTPAHTCNTHTHSLQPKSSSESYICFATAHPAKFGDRIDAAPGLEPAVPPQLQGLLDKPKRCLDAPNDRYVCGVWCVCCVLCVVLCVVVVCCGGDFVKKNYEMFVK